MQMYQLRTYQIKFIDAIRQAMRQYRRVLACAATGSGKSKVFIEIAKLAITRGRTVLVISESRKIFKQLSAELQCVEIAAGCKPFLLREGVTYLAMAQTLVNRDSMIANFDFFAEKLLVITDEIHIATPVKLLLQLQKAFHVGFTATPEGDHLVKLYDTLVVGPQPEELVNDGYLAPYRHYARVAADTDSLRIRNGEFTEESQEQIFETEVVYDSLEEDLRNLRYKKCLIFTSSIKHCDDVFFRLQDEGFLVTRVHSKLTKQDEAYQLGQFVSGDAPICVSVGVLTKGFDFPAIDLVILQRATTSTPLYLQMIGRGSRTSPGKREFTVLDYGANFSRLGMWDAHREWQDIWRKSRKEKKPGPPPVKLCPRCMFICPASAQKCSNCGHEFISNDEQNAIPDSKLIEITLNFKGKMISELTAKELAVYARLKNKRMYAIRIARAQQQKQDGFLREFATAMNYKNGWVYRELQSLPREKIDFYDFEFK